MTDVPQQEKEKCESVSLRETEGAAAPALLQNGDGESETSTTGQDGGGGSPSDQAASGAGILPDLGANYEVIEPIGQGGMGSVYKVRDKTSDRIVAVKVLQEALTRDAAALKRFEQEADSASQLNHSNLATVYGHGTAAGGAPYIVMDYIDGPGLAEVLKKEHHLEPKRALNIFLEICAGLEYAHDRGVIHRDIKPTNVIMTRTADGADSAHIVDFGIAKAAPTANRETHDLTQTGEIFGSPHYMSPEQCLGFLIDNRSDIYSLGCLMYETLIGGPPFEGANPIQLVVKHINEDAPPFPGDRKGDKVLEKLEGVVLRCLEKDKSLRYQSIEEVIKDLQAIKAGKQPTPYKRSAKPKPTLTKRQMLGVLVLFIAASVYFFILTGTIATSMLSNIFGVILLFLCGAGIYSFYSAAFEEFRKNKAAGLVERSAWLIVLSIGLGTCCTTLVPIGMALLFNYPPNGGAWGQFCGFAALSHVFAVSFTAISALAYLIFKSQNKAKPVMMAIKYLMVTAVTCSVLNFGVPVQTERVLMAFGQFAETLRYPDLARLSFEVCASLDKTDAEPLTKLADMAKIAEDYNKELMYVNLALSRSLKTRWDSPYPKDNLYERRAQIYEKLGALDKAIADYSQAIELEPDNQSYRIGRADLFVKLKNYAAALADLQRAALNNNGNSPDLFQKLARIHCHLLSFRAAINDLNQAIEAPGSQNLIQMRLMRAVLLEKVSGLASAINDYTFVARYAGDSDDELACKAYACFKLGRLAEYRKLINGYYESPAKIKSRLLEILKLPNVPPPAW